MSAWDDIAKSIRDGVDTVVEKTEELTKIGRIKVDIINIKRNIERNFSDLGGKVYHLIVDDGTTQIAGNSEVKEIIARVQELEKTLQDKNKELERVKSKEAAEQQQAEPVS